MQARKHIFPGLVIIVTGLLAFYIAHSYNTGQECVNSPGLCKKAESVSVKSSEMFTPVVIKQEIIQTNHSVQSKAACVREPVNIGQARKAAEDFLAKERKRQDALIEKGYSIRKSEVMKDSGGMALAYIHAMQPEGYIVTSADTGIRPIIAFSFKGSFSFDDRPNNVLLHMLHTDMNARQNWLNNGQTAVVAAYVQSNANQWVEYK